ncbi:MBOAT family O-acyltransferase [Lacrimispora sp. 210928-DFI.3.58]|uniref:MBOAT family O-acyltransferase n=1 Tax=Lacrimispora sp. 210928-DFI.3.58 TaxID=2883214 RepID=UPI0015B52774|nr:MBOAT family O-acyltransferase [Lacrimispora sp. 210928-DFI.3.58]MCB7320849.1 MBOAT family protein [Lacrimispora sp. 210928-DFI.3.58]
MLFSSLVFCWYFLPAVFLLYCCIPGLRGKNLLLLAASLFFYAWGEPKYVVLMVISIGLNFLFGVLIGREKGRGMKKALMGACIVLNLGILGYYKYFNFFAELVNGAAGHEALAARDIALPIGISFYSFQALSYVADVYRGKIRVQRNPLDLALYISFFPQLIAGPIVKYHEIDTQLKDRTMSADKIAYGIKRFSYGLGKKVILANTFAAVADEVFTSPNREMASRGLIWCAVLLYTLQIYYDFSGYSDMAIGLGKMFGFDFMENFNYPYMSQSIREFWHRWHISLSTWFKEYLYIPLGGNRKGKVRTYVNLFLVFLVTGLWHGAGANFILWGAYYGVFIVAERVFLGEILDRNRFKLLNHMYTMFVVIVGWMLFRVEELPAISEVFRVMFRGGGGCYTVPMFVDNRVFFWAFVGVLFCGPIQALCSPLKRRLYDEERISWLDVAVMAFLLMACTMLLVNNTYNPFIYFRF